MTRHVYIRRWWSSGNMSASETTAKVANPMQRKNMHADGIHVFLTTCKRVSRHSENMQIMLQADTIKNVLIGRLLEVFVASCATWLATLACNIFCVN